MNRALVAVEGSEATKEMLRLAGELAAGVDATLYLVHVTDEEEFSERADALATIPDVNVQYDVLQAREGAKQFAGDLGEEVLEGLSVSYEPIGRLGEVEDEILAVADEYDCDHLFITGRKRSPTGKALFGDRAQSLILNFDGPVTVTTA